MTDSLKIEFPGHSGQLLAARLDMPARPRAFALFAHCFTCGKDIFSAAHHPKSFVSLDTADHLLRKRADAVYAADIIGAWASRH